MYQIPYSGHHKWVQANTIFFTRHGSHAYGTNIATSDEDYRGVMIPPVDHLLGYRKPVEQVECKEPDLVIYDVRKFLSLAEDGNPNVIELLWTDPSDHLLVTPVGQQLIDARNLFISKKVKHTFSGYAISQLKRINNHYKWLKDPPKGAPSRTEFGLPERTVIPADQMAAAFAAVQKVMDSWEWKDLDDLDPSLRIRLINVFWDKLTEITAWSWEENRERVWLSAANSLGYDTNFIEFLDRERKYKAKHNEWNSYLKWKDTRNEARAELEAKFGYDTKHAMHLVRLMRMCEEILTTGQVIVKRPDFEELLAIRAGIWTYEELISWATGMEKKLELLFQSCKLPKEPSKEMLDKLCIGIVQSGFDPC